jgi:hypothetical protein
MRISIPGGLRIKGALVQHFCLNDAVHAALMVGHGPILPIDNEVVLDARHLEIALELRRGVTLSSRRRQHLHDDDGVWHLERRRLGLGQWRHQCVRLERRTGTDPDCWSCGGGIKWHARRLDCTRECHGNRELHLVMTPLLRLLHNHNPVEELELSRFVRLGRGPGEKFIDRQLARERKVHKNYFTVHATAVPRSASCGLRWGQIPSLRLGMPSCWKHASSMKAGAQNTPQ